MIRLASGIYRYWLDGRLQPIFEPWSLDRQPQGALLLRGSRHRAGASVFDMEADYDGAICTSLSMIWHRPAAARPLSVHYRRVGALLEYSFADQPQSHTLALAAENLLFPLLRAATGPLLPLLQGGRSLALPDLRDPTAGSPPLLHPLLSERHSEMLGTEADGLQHWRYYGGEYGDAGCDCWLGPHHLLHRYRWASPHGVWDVRLEALEQAEHFAGFAAYA